MVAIRKCECQVKPFLARDAATRHVPLVAYESQEARECKGAKALVLIGNDIGVEQVLQTLERASED